MRCSIATWGLAGCCVVVVLLVCCGVVLLCCVVVLCWLNGVDECREKTDRDGRMKREKDEEGERRGRR